MNREELKELGLSDDQIDKVMAGHGKVVNGIKDKADKVDGLEVQIEDYKQQIEQRDQQLNDLFEKAKGNEELTAEIDRLKEDNTNTKNEYEEKLRKQAFEHKLESTLSDAKVKNIKAVKALLDLDTIKLDGDKLLGLDDQLNGLKESESYLFEQETKPNSPQFVAPGNPNGGITTKSIAEMNYQELADLKANNPAKFAELTKQ